MATPEKPVEKYTVAELKTQLKARGLSQQGLRSELVARLVEALEAEPGDAARLASPEEGDQDVAEANGQGATEAQDMNEDPEHQEAEDQAAEGLEQPANELDGHALAEGQQAETTKRTDQLIEPTAAEATTQEPQAGEATQGTNSKEDKVPDEWEQMDIPLDWRPTPTFKVRQIPIHESCTEDAVRGLLEGFGLQVKSVIFDQQQILASDSSSGTKSALVRLMPPSQQAEAETHADGGDGGDAAKTPGSAEQGKKGGKSGASHEQDVVNLALQTVKRLKEADPPLELAGSQLQFDTGYAQVQLFVGNLTEEYSDDTRFRAAMQKHGKVERCFILRNPHGASKDYGFVEFSLPSGAVKAKEQLERIEMEMRPDTRMRSGKQPITFPSAAPTAKRIKTDGNQANDAASTEGTDGVGTPAAAEAVAAEGVNKDEPSGETTPEAKEQQQPAGQQGATTPGKRPFGRWDQVKLMRAEWANCRTVPALFARVLYVSNLGQAGGSTSGYKDVTGLRRVFEQYGPLNECHMPKNKMTGQSKGFAFVEFQRSVYADAAYRAINGKPHPTLGNIIVSFANPAKHYDPKAYRDTNAQQPQSTQLGNRLRSQQGERPGPVDNWRGRRDGTAPGGMGAGRFGGPGRGAGMVGVGGGMGMGTGMMGGAMGVGVGAGMMAAPGGVPPVLAAQLQQQRALQMQQAMQMQMQMAMRTQQVQAQMRAQQLAMQAQLREAQAQAQQFQRQAELLQQQAAAAQRKALQEAEARRIAEQEARAAAARARQQQQQQQQLPQPRPGVDDGMRAAGAGGHFGQGVGAYSGYGTGTGMADDSSYYGQQGVAAGYQDATGYGQQAAVGYGAQTGAYGTGAGAMGAAGMGAGGYSYGGGFGQGTAAGGGGRAAMGQGQAGPGQQGQAGAGYSGVGGSSMGGFGPGTAAYGGQDAASAYGQSFDQGFGGQAVYSMAGGQAGYGQLGMGTGVGAGMAAGTGAFGMGGGAGLGMGQQMSGAKHQSESEFDYQGGYGGGASYGQGQDFKRTRF